MGGEDRGRKERDGFVLSINLLVKGDKVEKYLLVSETLDPDQRGKSGLRDTESLVETDIHNEGWREGKGGVLRRTKPGLLFNYSIIETPGS